LTGLEQEMPKSEWTPEGTVVGVQVVPALVVATMSVPPTAVQEVALMQLMPESGVAPAGVPRSVHLVAPPFVVPMT
jgi:hypothetical protein